MEETEATVADINDGSRKKKKKGRTSTNNRNAKYEDADPLALNFESVCNHKKGKFKCQTLTMNEIVHNRKLLYEKRGKKTQDIYLVRLISPCPTERQRPRPSSNKRKKHKYIVKYFLLRDSKNLVKVCKSFFLAALGLSKNRVGTIASKIFDGKTPHDNRGGNRKSDKSFEKKESVRKFIRSLPARESHYNRRKSKRVYLFYELNIRKLWEAYNSLVPENLKVSETMYRRVFENDFNIGFSSPSCDVCSTCELLKNQQKTEKDPQKLQSLKVELRVHKVRAKRFFELAKEKPENPLTICFDLQQIQVLPKTPIQESFYLRQIGLYSFCVTDMDTKHPNFYIWTENQAQKVSTEIASGLFTHLLSVDFTGVETLRLFADGCGGQNKNSHVVHMLIFWLHNHAPANVTTIVLTFPVRGHSFLPADRVFGRVEKDLRKKPFILEPKTYHEIYAKHGTVHILGEDWNLYNVKALDDYYKKVDSIRDAKRIMIERKSTLTQSPNAASTSNTNIQGRGGRRRRGSARERGRGNGRGRRNEPALTHIRYGIKVSNFYNDLYPQNATSLLKTSKNHPTLPQKLACNHEIKQKKRKDVEAILEKQFGSNWVENSELQWFKTNIFNVPEPNNDDQSDSDDENNENDEVCDCCEPDMQEFV